MGGSFVEENPRNVLHCLKCQSDIDHPVHENSGEVIFFYSFWFSIFLFSFCNMGSA